MESIQQSVTQLSAHFNERMEKFQKHLQQAIPATSPTSNVAAQFQSFRSFVLTALEGLQLQVQLLYRSMEDIEMRIRHKILLVHGIEEAEKDEKLDSVTVKMLSDHLNIRVSAECVSHCHRLGPPKAGKPRAVLIKFHDLTLRNKLWYAKTALRNTGITLSEFLTKERHDIFVAARQRLGVNKCWTKDGNIFVLQQDGSRRRVRTLADLEDISAQTAAVSAPTAPVSMRLAAQGNPKVRQVPRAKRANKK